MFISKIAVFVFTLSIRYSNIQSEAINYFEVQDGNCIASQNYVTSPNYPGTYFDYEVCTILVRVEGIIEKIDCDLEDWYDLTDYIEFPDSVTQDRYAGQCVPYEVDPIEEGSTIPLHNRLVSVNETIIFKSDHSNDEAYRGFKLALKPSLCTHQDTYAENDHQEYCKCGGVICQSRTTTGMYCNSMKNECMRPCLQGGVMSGVPQFGSVGKCACGTQAMCTDEMPICLPSANGGAGACRKMQQRSEYWEIDGLGCTLSVDESRKKGACFESFAMEDSCNVTAVGPAGTFDVVEFDNAMSLSTLTLGGNSYLSLSELDGTSYTHAEKIYWTTNNTEAISSFKICAAGVIACLNVEGLLPNAQSGCQCGYGTVCSSEATTGLFCRNRSLESGAPYCSKIAPCTSASDLCSCERVERSQGPNTETCKCGTAECSKSSPFCDLANDYCYDSLEGGSSGDCPYKSGQIENLNDCTCGENTCTATNGRFCHANSNTCSRHYLAACIKTARALGPNSNKCVCGTSQVCESSSPFCDAIHSECYASIGNHWKTSNPNCIKVAGNCFESSLYGENTGYRAHENCTITALRSGTLSIAKFDVSMPEPDCNRDAMTFRGIKYCGGGSSMNYLTIRQNEAIVWDSSSNQKHIDEKAGFRICFLNVRCPFTKGLERNVVNCSCGASAAACVAGEYCQDLESTCSTVRSCPPGMYFGGKICHECPHGQYNHERIENTTFRCKTCSAGQYARNATAIVCEACDMGKYQSLVSASEYKCKSCTVGYYTRNATSQSCVACGHGMYQELEEATDYACKTCPAGYAYVSSNSSCSICNAGQYQNENPSTASCKICGKGQYVAIEGQTHCKKCEAGKFLDDLGKNPDLHESEQNCKICPPGQISRSGDEFCFNCPAGWTNSSANSSAPCRECSPGKKQIVEHDNGLRMCQNCTPGSFQGEPGKTFCLPCISGKFQSELGQASCHECPAQTFSQSSSAISCDPCPTGSDQPEEGKANCFECIPGQHKPQSSNGNCIVCVSGMFASESGSDECQSCPQGWYSLHGAMTCTACSAGKFQSELGQASCHECPAQTFSQSSRAISCDPCPQGSDQPEEGKANCFECMPGRHKPQSSNGNCIVCVSGMFASESGSDECQSCPQGWYSLHGAMTCTACSAGKFQSELGQVSCKRCEKGRFLEDEEQPKTACRACPRGYFAEKEGMPFCSMCQAGDYSDVGGSETCKKCAPGKWQNEKAAKSCKKLSECPKSGQVTNEQQTGCVTEALDIDRAQEPSQVLISASLSSVARQIMSLEWTLSTENISPDADSFQVEISLTNRFLSSSLLVFVTEDVETRQVMINLTDLVMFNLTDLVLLGYPEPLHQVVRYARVRQYRKDFNRGSMWSLPSEKWTKATDCKSDFLDTSQSNPLLWSCCKCPKGAFCGGNIDKHGVVGLPGYFRVPSHFFLSPDFQTRNSLTDYKTKDGNNCTMSPLFVLCPFQDRCLGYNTSNASLLLGVTHPYMFEGCKKGTTGPMCALCESGWALEGNLCSPCTAEALGRKIAIVLVVLTITLILAMIFRRYFRKAPRRLNKLKKDIFRILVIVLNFSQIATSLPSVFNVKWPQNYLHLLNQLSFFNVNVLELTGANCATSIDHADKVWAMACLPAILFVYAIVKVFWGIFKSKQRIKMSNEELRHKLWLDAVELAFDIVDHEGDESMTSAEIIKLFKHFNKTLTKVQAERLIIDWSNGEPITAEDGHCEISRESFLKAIKGKIGGHMISKEDRDAAIEWTDTFQSVSQVLASIGELMFAIHAPVSQAALEWFWFIKVGDVHVLKVDPNIIFSDDRWSATTPAAIFVVSFLTVGLPLFLIAGLALNRDSLDSVGTLSRIGWMYDRYTHGVEWWSIHEVIRKCILTGMLIFVDVIELRVAIALIVSTFAIINLNFWSPFRNHIVFWVCQVAFLMTTVKYIVASFRLALANSADVQNNEEWDRTIGLFLICTDVLTFTLFALGAVLCVVVMNKEIVSLRGILKGNVGAESKISSRRVRSIRKVTPKKVELKTNKVHANTSAGNMAEGRAKSRVPRPPRRRLTLTVENIEKAVTNEKLVRFEARQEEEHKQNIAEIRKRQDSSKQKLKARLAKREIAAQEAKARLNNLTANHGQTQHSRGEV